MENEIARGRVSEDGSCLAKKAYTIAGAEKAKRAMKSKNKPVRIYHCRFCALYHLTSME
jgi:hypothetical protein